MKIIDEDLLNEVSAQAACDSRFRKNFNFHKSLDENVQRFLNALEPNTFIPIHRHRESEETMILLRGRLNVNFYNDKKEITKTVELNMLNGKYGISIPKELWHDVEVLETGTVVFEIKEGPYTPIKEDDILKY